MGEGGRGREGGGEGMAAASTASLPVNAAMDVGDLLASDEEGENGSDPLGDMAAFAAVAAAVAAHAGPGSVPDGVPDFGDFEEGPPT